MPRPTRSSNAARKKTLGGSNSSGNRNRTISPSRNKSGTPRKSLRSVKASPAPSVASSASTVSTTAATRSLRKRAPPSPEKDSLSTTQASISDGTGFKRRRVSMPPSPDPSPTPAPVKGATPTGRKRRGLQKEASTKRVKPSPQAPDPATPLPSSSTTTPSLKRRRQAAGERNSGAEEGEEDEEEEEEEEEHSSHSLIITASTAVKKRGAKRSRRVPRKTSAEVEEVEAPIPTPTTAEKEEDEEVMKAGEADKLIEEDEKDEELTASSPPKSPVAEVKTSLSKKELLALQRRQLLQHLDHYDLSDLTSLSSLLATWPESELRVALTAPPSLPISASQRLWVSTEGPPTSRTALNGDSYEADATPTKAAEEVPGAKRARRHISPVPRTDARVGGPGSGGGEHETENAANTMEKNRHPHLLDTFCVASFTLPTCKDKDTAAGDGVQLDEHEHLVHDIAAINPDVFCVKQAHVDYAALHLRPELSRQGYQCSGGTDGTAASYQSFIFFSREVFSEVAFHCRSVQSMARKLVEHCAYAQLWRDTLSESLKSSCTGDRSGSNTSNDSQLLVSVLRHLATGSLLLVGCLTERLHPVEFPSPPPSHPVTAVVPTVTPIIVPYVECAGGGGSGTAGGGCCASTITVSVAGCHSSLGGPPSEWCPPSFDSRPDLAAINASGCLWALHEIWQEVQESGQAGATTPLVNGYNGNGHPLLPSATPLSPMRWVLCANLEASPSSPAYQIFCDGYPSDESIARLRAVRNIHLRNNDFLDATSLLDLLWHAFQHPCTDVRSCYQSVMGTEPPFTRYSTVPSSSPSSAAATTTVIPRKCVDYIFCSGSSLHPRQVLMPPCRATLGVASDSVGQMQRRICSATPYAAVHETAFPLASKVGIVAASTTA